MNHAMLSFNGGEVSPYLKHRIDFEKTASSAELMQNFLPNPIGSMMKRPGLQHITTITHDTTKGLMHSFVSSDGTAYLLCIDEANGITVIRAADGTVADTVPYLTDSAIPDNFVTGTHSMRELQVTAINDVAFLTHPFIAPTRLSRVSDTNWILEPIPFDYYPIAIENTDPDNLLIVTATAGAAAAWSASTVSYVIGSLVTYGGSTWVCNYAHTSSATKYPVDGPKLILNTSDPVPAGYYLHSSTTTLKTYKPIWKLDVNGSIAYPGSGLAISSNAGIFSSAMVGSRFRFSRARTSTESQITHLLNSPDSTSIGIYVQKKWTITTFGTWDGTLKIQTSPDGSTWTDHKTYFSNKNRNVSEEGELDDPAFMRLDWDYVDTGTGDPMAIFDCLDAYLEGWFEITAVTDVNTATATAKSVLYPSTSFLYAEAAFTKNQGFPAACTLHESRLAFGGTARQPTSVWISCADDLVNFETGPDDSDAIASTLAAPVSDPIRWMASQRRLFIGTSRAEYVSGSETSDQPISPSNFTARRYTNSGSRLRRPMIYSDGLLFIGRAGGRLWEIGYDSERGSYSTEDLTRLSEHLTKAGITGMAYQQTREPQIWLIREDGVLLNFLYSRRERIAAWSQHSTTGGTFTDVAIIPNDSGDDDVFFLVKRGSSTCLERFPAGWQNAQETNANWLALDGTYGTGTTISIPAHLRNIPITRLLAGDTVPAETTQTYTGATATISSQDWQVGLPIAASYVSLPIDMTAQDGSTQARRKRPHKLALSLYKARGGQVWNLSQNAAQDIPNTQPTAVLRDGWEDVIPDAGHLDNMQIKILHDDPFPFTVRAALIKWQLNEP